MIRNRATGVAGAACAGLLACWGCVERDEVITVGRDGSVTIELEYEGTEEELSQGDAMPSAASGWDVARSVKKERDEVRHVLKSRRRFEPREEVPRTFAAPDDPDAGLYLEFPTTVRMETRPDGVYYYFRRVYTPRRWAYVQHWQDFIFDDDIKKLSEKPADTLTRDDRLKIVYAFATFEAMKQLEFAKAAIRQARPDLPVEYALMARKALLDFEEKQSDYYEHMIESCRHLPEDEQGDCFNEEAEQILAGGYAAFVQSLRTDAGMDDAAIAKFEKAYDQAEHYYKISEALGGHAFEIVVRMPGTIVAHNSLDTDVEEEENGMSNVRFEFDGKAFRDRTHELIVVSRLEADSGAKSRSRTGGGAR